MEQQLLMEALQLPLSILYFSFAISFLYFSLIFFFLRSRPGCNSCELCKSYLDSSWSKSFDNIVDWYAHLLRQSPTQTIHIHVLDNIITANPDNVEYMLKTNFDNFPKGKAFSSILGDLLGNGIFNVDGERWNFQRKMASLELGSLSVRTHAFAVVSDQLRTRLFPLLHSVSSGGGANLIDLQDIFRRFSFDTICKISFGIDAGCLDLSLPMSEFAAAFDTATGLSARRAAATSPALWRLKRLLNWGSERELRKAIGLVDMLADEVIRQRKRLGFSSRDDLLSRFMGSVTDDKYLRDIAVSFLLAGRDTVASGLTAFFFLLSSHPEVVAKMREEIDGVLLMTNNCCSGQDYIVPSYDELRAMNYVHAALYECLRLYPPVQFDSKFCLEDDVLPDGTFVKKGTRVTYHPYAMGRMESIWGADYSSFKPERWLRDGAFVPKNPYEFPVFQGGRRVCLGKEMALMDMKTVVVSVIREFDVEVAGGVRLPKFASGLTATLSGGLPARVHLRHRRVSEECHC
ncbi:putative cytochrome P450 94C1 [Iris pallida]|uniref:noroxomaritidine synthase n=1 Tax=Iris pallida TaxID=29817 RepID=A0AAX6DRW8_IRIPA|nr:putative cytochrome P450 94C1 [Iris pallida]